MIIWSIISAGPRLSRCWKREQVTEPVFINRKLRARGFSRRLPRDKLFVFTRLFTSPRKLLDDPDIRSVLNPKQWASDVKSVVAI